MKTITYTDVVTFIIQDIKESALENECDIGMAMDYYFDGLRQDVDDELNGDTDDVNG